MICSRRSLKKNDHERIALIALYKRATESKSISSLFYKRATMRESLSSLLKRSDESDSPLIWVNRSKKTSYSLKKNCIFCKCFTTFPLFMPRGNRSLLHSSFLESDGSNSLSSLFTKEQPWENRSFTIERLWAFHSHCFLQKRDGSVSKSLFCSFAHKKTSDSLEKPKSKFPTLWKGFRLEQTNILWPSRSYYYSIYPAW